jgi:hypothetical protein
MKSIDRITDRAYRLAKSNPQARRLMLSALALSTKGLAFLRSRGNGWREATVPVGEASSTKEWVESATQRSGGPLPSYTEVHPRTAQIRYPPKSIYEKTHWQFEREDRSHSPETFVASIPGGRVLGDGHVITPDNLVLGDLFRHSGPRTFPENPLDNPPFREKFHPRPMDVDGTVAVLSVPHGRGYYHWMLELLPRIEILRRAGFELGHIDKFIVNTYASWQRETLTALGISGEDLIQSLWNPHVKARRLLVPSFPGERFQVPKWACDFLRSTFLDSSSATASGPTRIQISRVQATHRHVENQAVIDGYLQKLGFVRVAMEQLSMREKAALLANAEAVLAPHGSGLVNLVFCSPGCKVIELFSPTAIDPLFWRVSCQLQLDYLYVVGQGDTPEEGRHPVGNVANMAIEPDELMATMRLAGIS